MAEAKVSISIGLCTYNGSAFLREQLDSIAAQTRLPDELVICDDGSTDSTPLIVEDFARSVPFPVRWIRNEKNIGSTKNFEKAIGLCSGDLIALSDQDDIWLPEKLARQSEMFERDPALGGVFSDAELVDANNRDIGERLWQCLRFSPEEQKQFLSGNGIQVLLKKHVITGATLMIRADLRSLFSPVPAFWYHDGWIAWMMALYSKITLIQEPLIRYRIHPNQQVGVATRADSRRLSFRQRLERVKRDEPPRYLAIARETEELVRKLQAANDAPSQAVLPVLRLKARFFSERGTPSKNRLLHTLKIIGHSRDYRVYEGSWRPILRDILIAYV